jgi:hypothetical protein
MPHVHRGIPGVAAAVVEVNVSSNLSTLIFTPPLGVMNYCR